MAPHKTRRGRRPKTQPTLSTKKDDQHPTPLGRFGKLPLEIRQKIYREYFELFPTNLTKHRTKPDPVGPTLLYTSRTLNLEARPICTAVVRSSISMRVRDADDVDQKDEVLIDDKMDRTLAVYAHNMFNGERHWFALNNTQRLHSAKHLDIQVPTMNSFHAYNDLYEKETAEEASRKSDMLHITEVVSQLTQIRSLSIEMCLKHNCAYKSSPVLDCLEGLFKPLMKLTSIQSLELVIGGGDIEDEAECKEALEFIFGYFLGMLQDMGKVIKIKSYHEDVHPYWRWESRDTMTLIF